jgi:hypothetical protein
MLGQEITDCTDWTETMITDFVDFVSVYDCLG